MAARVAQLAGLAFAAALLAAWLLVDPRTPDLAAQTYRVDLFRSVGLALWDEHWYAGHHLPAYSLLYPPLGALLGVRLLGTMCVLFSTALFARLARSAYGAVAAAWATPLFALAAVGDVWAGRTTFALGVPLALGCVLALRARRPWPAVALALACAAASPVAGALLGLAGVTLALARRSPRPALLTALPAGVLVLALALLFAEGGWEPYPIRSFAATIAVVALFLGALAALRGRLPGARDRTLWLGGLLYALVCVAALAVHTPLGSNVERYAVLLAGPLLLCAWLSPAGADEPASPASLPVSPAGLPVSPAGSPVSPAGAIVRPRGIGAHGLVAAALALWAAWVVWGPVRETAAVAGSPATSASYYAPVVRFLDAVEARRGPVRVEVPLTRSHWEAALLAPRFSLARGWEKQLDERYDAPLLSHDLSAGAYRRWLLREAVAYVALPDVTLDPSSAREGRLIAAGLPYLRLVFAGRHWRVYEVRGATPLVSGPARLTALAHESFSLAAPRAGRALVRVRFSRYLTVTQGRGCVSGAPGGWTAVDAPAPGRLVVSASFSLARALGGGSHCR